VTTRALTVPSRASHNQLVPCRRTPRPTRHFALSGAVFLLLAIAVLVTPPIAPAADYEVGRGDVLKVIVVGQAEMSTDYTVDPEGMVNFPILGKVKAAELTLPELERKLTTLLADGYLKRPQVTVSIAEYGSQKVFVTGEVQKPGQYALKLDRSLLALLGDIGPLTPNAGHEVVVVRPPPSAVTAPGTGEPSTPGTGATDDGLFPAQTAEEKAGAKGGTEAEAPGGAAETPATAPAPSPVPGLPYVPPGAEIYRISLFELQSGNPERNIGLQAGDIVFFPRASQVYVMGSVARPGPYRYQEGMTVLQVLTLAGGVTERGSEGRTKFVRIVDGKKVETRAHPTDLVQPEDTLYVPERFF
jgi:polysaccharide export outer membrane protein